MSGRADAADCCREAEALRAQLDEQRTARLRLELQLRAIENEARQLATRWNLIEQRNMAISNLYVAIHQLHGSLARREVLEALQEILVGLIGSEMLAVFERCHDGMAFKLIASAGIDEDAYRELDATHDPLGRLIASGTRYVAGDGIAPDLAEPLAAVLPLRLDGCVTGGIVLFALLSQKEGFHEVDYELFDLLATHAAIALHCTCGEVAA
jgi:hypothetical protein